MRLGILLSHPIQYLSAWFGQLASKMEIEVLYACRQDANGQAAAGFGVEFEWDVPLLVGYPYRWLQNVARSPDVRSFWGVDTPELYDLIRRTRFDAFLVFGWKHKSSLQAILACWRHGVPVLMRGDSQRDTPRSLFKKAAKYLPYRWLLPRLDGHLYVGRRNRSYLMHYGVPHERLFFVPHFVDNAYFAERARNAELTGRTFALRRTFGVPRDGFVVLFVGKMIAKKRPGDFLEACLQLFPAHDDIHAILVGDGPLRPTLQKLVSSVGGRCTFAGFRNQSELPTFYRSADVLVLCSDAFETWGLVANEAFACGLPVIASDGAGCVPDLIEEGFTGFTYSRGDVRALAARVLDLRTLLRTHPDRIRAALAAKLQTYSMATATAGLEEALRTVACCE